MKAKTINLNIILIISSLFLASCATIVGGSKYYAKVQVVEHPNAGIYVKNRLEGKGNASFLVRRKDANKFTLTIKKEGCEDQTFKYQKRALRGWSIFGTIVGFTFGNVADGIILPIGIIVDVANGAIWKPDLGEAGITKLDYKHYAYNIDYTGCKTQEKEVVIWPPVVPEKSLIERAKSKADRLREMKKLVDEGILTQEEYEKEKAKILEEK